MADVICGAVHPDDYGPIQRRCGLLPRHDPPHRFWGFAANKNTEHPDEWEDAS